MSFVASEHNFHLGFAVWLLRNLFPIGGRVGGRGDGGSQQRGARFSRHLFLHTFDNQIFTVLSLKAKKKGEREKKTRGRCGGGEKEIKENTTKRENKRGSITQPSLSKHQMRNREVDFKVCFTPWPHTHTHTLHYILLYAVTKALSQLNGVC